MKPPEVPAGVSRETMDQLRRYHDLLIKWQAKINLISPATVPDAWSRHFVDSIQLMPLMPETPTELYDLGCGAGFPGLVLAILKPNLSVTLIESDAKKCAFLQTVSRETGVAVTVRNSRIEDAAKALRAPDLVTARALAPLEKLLEYVRPWAEKNPEIKLVFPKGAQYQAEIDEANAAGWGFDCHEMPSVTEKSARILSLTNIHYRALRG